jgi:uncharacterized protein
MNRVVHFEIYATNPHETIEFYRHVFGWKIEPWGPPEAEYWHISTGGEEPASDGLDGGLWRRRGPSPLEGSGVNAYSCTIEVEDIDITLEKVKSAGGSISVEKNQIPGVGWLAYCKDTDGNLFGVVQR